MMRAVSLVCLFGSAAHASPLDGLTQSTDGAEWGDAVQPPGATPKLEKMPAPRRQLALAVNNPIAWAGFAYAASGYVALTDHQALRVNLASFKSTAENPGLWILAASLLDAEDEAERRGGFFDVGAGWMYFPRRVWSGSTFELGAVLRTRHTYVSDEYASPEVESLDTTTVAGRMMFGWHWDIRSRAFIAIAAGASCGYEAGTRTTMGSYDSPTAGHDLARWTPGFEWYSRIGTMF